MADEGTDKRDGLGGTDTLQQKTADLLDEIAERIRNANLSSKGDEIRGMMHDAETQVNRFLEETGGALRKENGPSAQGIEQVIRDHPVPAVLAAAGAGLLLGLLLSRRGT